MNISSAMVLVSNHKADKVYLTTDAPSTFPLVNDEPLTLTFSVQAGNGVKYVRDNFNMEPEVYHAR